MKIAVKKTGNKAKKRSGFPRLMMRKRGDCIVLFVGPGIGMQLSGSWPGFYSEVWKMKNFTDLPPGDSILLTQEDAK